MSLTAWKALVEAALPRLVPSAAPPRLQEAMLYSLMAGGKRFRPLLVMASARALGAHPEPLAQAACALEFIHTYSLIHDDLPAMDDDTLRRGMPTSHVKFGEALAILAGDALNTEAFRILTLHPSACPAQTRLRAVEVLAWASGGEGMAGGQVLDMDAQGAPATEERLLAIHAGKTARLIQASIVLGALYAGADAESEAAFAELGLKAGLLFQVADDILDETSTAEEMGKSTGKDLRQGKLTAPAVWGLEDAIERARGMESDALKVLEPLGPPAEELRELVRMVCAKLPKNT
jgi:geranylgeranyl diphosphate synthase type II